MCVCVCVKSLAFIPVYNMGLLVLAHSGQGMRMRYALMTNHPSTFFCFIHPAVSGVELDGLSEALDCFILLS